MSAAPATRGRDLALEGVRGLCALLVVIGHMTYQAPLLDPGYACDLLHVDYGPQAVFVFFVLSGYVIGLTTFQPATGQAIRHYCSRRLLRIVPIAWIAILLASIIFRHDGFGTVLGNMLFLQNAHPYPLGLRVPVLYDDPPLWSLSYEMLYYAAFIAVWKWRPRMSWLLPVLVVVALGDLIGLPSILSHLAAYFIYWVLGLCIAWQTSAPAAETTSAWPAAVGAAFVMWTVEPVHALLESASSRMAMLDWDRFHVDALAGSLLIVLAAARRAPLAQRRLTFVAIAAGLVVLPLKLWMGNLSYVDLAGAAVLCACLGVRNWRPDLKPLAAFAPVGVVSYALYVTAYPLMRAVYRCPFLPSGSLGTFLMRAVVLALLCAASALFLERFLQPRMVRWLTARLGLGNADLPQAAPSSAAKS